MQFKKVMLITSISITMGLVNPRHSQEGVARILEKNQYLIYNLLCQIDRYGNYSKMTNSAKFCILKILPISQYSPTLLNNTRHIEKPTLFFNRVPKVGSQTLMDLISKLSTRNGFEFHRDGTQKVETIKLSFYEEVSR